MVSHNIILASTSPRRKDMLAWTGLPFQTISAEVDEQQIAGELPLAYVSRLAEEKANKVSEQVQALVIAADTIVVFNDEILGKPKDAEEAKMMLVKMRAKSHRVYTALAINLLESNTALRDICISDVCMRNYDEGEIARYVESGDPLDKAGAYAIQHPHFNPVTNFQGCFPSVMGLPLCHLERNLRKIAGYNSLQMPDICQSHLHYVCPIFNRVLAGEEVG